MARDGVLLRGEGRAGRHTVAVVKPQTYMNRSGEAFRSWSARDGSRPRSWSRWTTSTAAGHDPAPRLGGTGGTPWAGVDPRLNRHGRLPETQDRRGPGASVADLPEYVLGRFGPEERPRLDEALEGPRARSTKRHRRIDAGHEPLESIRTGPVEE